MQQVIVLKSRLWTARLAVVIAIAALVAIPVLVFTKPVAKVEGLGTGAILVMHDSPCLADKALEQVKAEFRDRFKHGEYTGSNGKSIVACWAVNGATIYIVDEEGDKGQLPVEAAQPIRGKESS